MCVTRSENNNNGNYRILNPTLFSFRRSLQIIEDDGLKRHLKSDIVLGEISKAIYSLKDSGDPLTAKAHIEHALTLNFDATTSNPIKSGIIYKLRRPKIEIFFDNYCVRSA